MSSRARDQKILRGLIESDQLAVMIGSGVSKAVCPEAPMWRDLSASGLALLDAAYYMGGLVRRNVSRAIGILIRFRPRRANEELALSAAGGWHEVSQWLIRRKVPARVGG